MSRAGNLLRRGRGQASSEPATQTVRNEREPGEPLRIAAITFCRDEGRMLPLWIKYYGAQFGVENLYVVDDNSEDGSTDDLPCDVLRIPPIRG
ncbi:MAG: glycosyltransferase family 2 protein, partial [Marmoricola sp.]